MHIFIKNLPEAKFKQDKEAYNFKSNWFVFGGIKPYSEVTARKHLIKYIEKAKCKHITLHGFRHSHTSYLLEYSNLSDVLIAERLGHTVEMLQKTYTHIYRKRNIEMDNYIKNIDFS